MKSKLLTIALVITLGCRLLGEDGSYEYEVRDIVTLSGETYLNAVIEGINSRGIDIGYINSAGKYVLKGIDFKDLPESLRQEFGYDPAAAKALESKLKPYANADIEELTVAEKDRLGRIIKELKDKLAGVDVTIKPEDLRFAIFANRSSVSLNVIEPVATGSAVKVVSVLDGRKIKSEIIIIDNIDLPDTGLWSGFVYPTGLKANYRGQENVPVYTDSLRRALELVNHYLDVYSQYGRAGAEATGEEQKTAPPDVAENLDYEEDNSTADSNPENYANNTTIYYDGVSYPGVYYIGVNYWPVYWWSHHYRPRPPRPPHPPNPPRPPAPTPRPPAPTPRPPAPTPRPPAPPRPNPPQPGPITPAPAPSRPEVPKPNLPVRPVPNDNRTIPADKPKNDGRNSGKSSTVFVTPSHSVEGRGNFRQATPIPETTHPALAPQPGQVVPPHPAPQRVAPPRGGRR